MARSALRRAERQSEKGWWGRSPGACSGRRRTALAAPSETVVRPSGRGGKVKKKWSGRSRAADWNCVCRARREMGATAPIAGRTGDVVARQDRGRSGAEFF